MKSGKFIMLIVTDRITHSFDTGVNIMKSGRKILPAFLILTLLVSVCIHAGAAEPVITVTPGTTAPKAGSSMTLTYNIRNLDNRYILGYDVYCDKDSVFMPE